VTWGIEVGVIGLAAGLGRGSQPGELGGPESDIAGVLAISVARVLRPVSGDLAARADAALAPGAEGRRRRHPGCLRIGVEG
jgi:hypothetical protein